MIGYKNDDLEPKYIAFVEMMVGGLYLKMISPLVRGGSSGLGGDGNEFMSPLRWGKERELEDDGMRGGCVDGMMLY